MLIFLEGTDSFLAKKAIDQLKERYLAKNPDGVELTDIDAEIDQPNWANLQAVPLFAHSRLVIIQRAGLLVVKEQESLAEFLAHLPASTVAVVWDAKALPDKSSLLAVLAKAEKRVEVSSLEPNKVRSWLRNQAKTSGIELTEEIVDDLVDRFGNDLWGLSSELLVLGSTGASTSSWRRAQESERFAYFRLLRTKDWSGIKKQLQLDHRAGVPIELVIGSLGSAIRKEINTDHQLGFFDLLLDLDFGYKTGLLDDSQVYSLLISHLPKAAISRVQWEKLWQEIS